MSKETDFDSLLNEVLENLLDYDSPEKIERLKIKLKYLQEVDDNASVYVADYGESFSDKLNAISTSGRAYLFCLPGVVTSGNISNFADNVRLVPVSTAFTGGIFSDINLTNKGYFISAYLRDCNFNGALMNGIDLTGADLSNSYFQNADLSNAILHNANFCGADLSSAILPDSCNTTGKFKKTVGAGNWNGETTIWNDGYPLDYGRLEPEL